MATDDTYSSDINEEVHVCTHAVQCQLHVCIANLTLFNDAPASS